MGVLPYMAYTGCVAGQGMIYNLTRVCFSKAYNFERICPNYKQGIACTIDLT